MKRCLLLTAALLTAFGTPGARVLATEYFVVDNGAPTGGTGTQASPWGTIAEALGSGTAWAPGDVINVAAGTYGLPAESFPLAVPDGVTLAGAGPQQSLVDAAGAASPVFTVAAGTSTTVLRDLGILADASATGVALQGGQADFQLLNCTLAGGAAGLLASYSATASQSILLQSNVFSGFSATGIRLTTLSTGPLGLAIRSNSFTGAPGSAGIQLRLAPLAASTASFTVAVSGNMMSSLTSVAARLVAAPSAGEAANASFVVAGNEIAAAQLGLVVGMDVNGGTGTLDMRLQDNICSGVSGFGILFGASAATAGVARVSGTVQGNAVRGAATGFLAFGNASGGASNVIDVDVLNNCATANSAAGFRFLVSGAGGLTAALGGNVLANLSMDNPGAGVLVSASATGFTPLLLLNFGDTVLSGRNTIQGNNTASVSGVFEFDFNGPLATTVSARGNYWGTIAGSFIESAVDHRLDDPTLPLLDFGGPLTPGLSMVAPGSARPGANFVVTAADTSPFVEFAGDKRIAVTVGGTPVLSLTVAADGSSLSFVVPVVLAGVRVLQIINPGGQSGVLLLAVIDDNGGICFVATAAYGDDEAPEVWLLRRWRDECLAGNPLGRLIVRAYYAISPGLAEAVAERPWARSAARAALTPVVGAVRLWLTAPWAAALLAGLLGLRVLRLRK